MTKEKIKSVLESLMFVMGEPLEAKTAAELFEMPTADIVKIFRELAADYEERGSGLCVREMDKAFQLCTNPENDDYIRILCTPVREKKLSQSSLEVLAIIAYKQPVTKSQIDAIRGIRSDRVLESLMKRGLIKELGRSDGVGRPYLYGTTRQFLELFGFESLSELPEIEDADSLVLEDEDFEEPVPDQLTMPV
ncbi:MAG: SMC-Scp complex subunit ScpB [Firmicutes bacterium]|nr:SMC-Scp complex subunit ScpB [Bacillota bacterium]